MRVAQFGPDEPTIAASFRLGLLRRSSDPGLVANLLIFSLVYWSETVTQARAAVVTAGLVRDELLPFVDLAFEAGVVIDPALI